jgi:NADH-quinone oxidoreductase subunit C
VIPLSSADVVDAPAGEGEGEAERDELRQGILDRFTAELGDAVVGSHIRPARAAGSGQDGDLWVRVERYAWPAAAEVARQRLGCHFFDFLSGIDWLPSPFGRELDAEVDNPAAREPAPPVPGYAGGDTRFQVFGRVVNVRQHWGVTLKADLPDGDLSVGTWSRTYLGANWHERETHEMFGFVFVGHPGLANLYLPAEFEGYPLRKDFPLLARRVKPWPGIVDVEPMPGDDTAEAAAEGGAE